MPPATRVEPKAPKQQLETIRSEPPRGARIGTCNRVSMNRYKAQVIPSKYLGEPDIVVLVGKANKFRARMKLCVTND